MFKNFFRKVARWAYAEELQRINEHIERMEKASAKLMEEVNTLRETQNKLRTDERKVHNLLDNISISADFNPDGKAGSWAVISIEGEHADYLKFITLGKNDAITIAKYLSQFKRVSVDAHPSTVGLIRGQILEIKKKENKQ